MPAPIRNPPALTDDVIALQPRRVRTMVVRPDGSIVPRDEAGTGSKKCRPKGTTAAAPALEQPSSADIHGPGHGAGGKRGRGGDRDQACRRRSRWHRQRVPSLRPRRSRRPLSPHLRRRRLHPRRRPQLRRPSRSQPSIRHRWCRRRPRSSEWSMQIASQPSSDSAQATYQDLARRYSSLLEGRGVNIRARRGRRADRSTGCAFRWRAATRPSICATSYQSAGGSCFVSR